MEIVKYLGINIVRIQDLGLIGAKDQIVIEKAQELKSVLVINDLDFADIRTYPPSKFNGIIVLRMQPKLDYIDKVHNMLRILLQNEKHFAGKLFVVDWNKYRERHTP
ncbi:DUF5615 family PIN-like protein [Calditrichota bacterium]